ncbi:uncharacterized protein K452DRAFT_358292 [Aplosporella prunicola CBS 121167]|uniref:Zn(2)-C6 fungal-type domain-containing protein n=1 Tax=Aplosporella prunicola CBS 121167 TaxID=1176127 RepID=A0A6A6BEF5_9PEZI|nr:uncharacterized protein K452DRAFT_358292 [Aplosporella prunicola CBS 121167]KAF2142530.1 hypothetical protein K452DRAFT_358292 [Aplosporella prunicola CBS 121167]
MDKSLAPNAVRGGGQNSERDTVKEKKRKCVPLACTACRRRKSKCDGATPCSSCSAVYKTVCNYDADKPSTKKRNFEEHETSTPEALSSLVTSLKSLPENEAATLIRQIQGCDNIEALAKNLQTVNLNQARSDSQGRAAPAPENVVKSHSDGVRRYGSTSMFSFRAEDIQQQEDNWQVPTEPHHGNQTWTAVTTDIEFVYHILRLYFTWSHPFHPVGLKELFYEAFQEGTTRHCNALLVNAILSYGCHYSDRPEARENPQDPRTAGNRFFAEAQRLLHCIETSSIPTVQAVAIMSLREISQCRDSSGYRLIRQCMAMAIELGLHLALPPEEEAKLDSRELVDRSFAFWGCFVIDVLWGLCIGRVSSLPSSAITLDKSTLANYVESPAWEPYNDSTAATPATILLGPTVPQFLYHFASLSEIMNEMVFICYASKSQATSAKVLSCWTSYQSWYQTLPRELSLDVKHLPTHTAPLPHVLLLHMCYHCCVLQLFHFFANVILNSTNLKPREIRSQSAGTISDIMGVYRNTYGVRCGAQLTMHVLIWACIAHLHDCPSEAASRKLLQGIEDLYGVSTNHPFAAECVMIIHRYAQKLNKSLPVGASHIITSIQFGFTKADNNPVGVSSNNLSIAKPWSRQGSKVYPLSMKGKLAIDNCVQEETTNVPGSFDVSASSDSSTPPVLPSTVFFNPQGVFPAYSLSPMSLQTQSFSWLPLVQPEVSFFPGLESSSLELGSSNTTRTASTRGSMLDQIQGYSNNTDTSFYEHHLQCSWPQTEYEHTIKDRAPENEWESHSKTSGRVPDQDQLHHGDYNSCKPHDQATSVWSAQSTSQITDMDHDTSVHRTCTGYAPSQWYPLRPG